jgi:hypothetical protein
MFGHQAEILSGAVASLIASDCIAVEPMEQRADWLRGPLQGDRRVDSVASYLFFATGRVPASDDGVLERTVHGLVAEWAQSKDPRDWHDWPLAPELKQLARGLLFGSLDSDNPPKAVFALVRDDAVSRGLATYSRLRGLRVSPEVREQARRRLAAQEDFLAGQATFRERLAADMRSEVQDAQPSGDA